MITSTIYFNLETNEQISAAQVSKCGSIEAIDFSCAVVCSPFIDNNCWLDPIETCWITESENYWEL